VAVTEISEAPFGFLGWKAFAAWRAAATPADQRLSDFLKLVEAGRSFYREGRVVVVPPAAERRSLHPAGELRAWPAGRRAPRFPLTDAEWAAWLREPSP
jgi:hypothetical protein